MNLSCGPLSLWIGSVQCAFPLPKEVRSAPKKHNSTTLGETLARGPKRSLMCGLLSKRWRQKLQSADWTIDLLHIRFIAHLGTQLVSHFCDVNAAADVALLDPAE